jgi:hypothetical protein
VERQAMLRRIRLLPRATAIVNAEEGEGPNSVQARCYPALPVARQVDRHIMPPRVSPMHMAAQLR